ncbi:flagellar biosynthesis protein FlhA [Paraferrimonas sp. SM1919]|uniref:flagellar biosynthesis protein FlhA n=1 Tax=Paraferrimonas sp. SM1919 TaxID=2662263 RepID=UPI0013D2D024|nr:flagellar biosynthesis protein FlhA [Paraferrimonas sp. SM1919]
MNFSRISALFKNQQAFIGIPILLLAVLAMIILPLPPLMLDALFTFNIVLAIMVLLVSVSTNRPLEFSIFPTVLLIATLMRLTLNVASTRVVLQEGHNGGEAAGKVIQAFGEVVIGGNYVVGMVVFLILMIINFVVITKGGERISEVGARFTLDALPGKQMAIDADLNAGVLTQEQARDRRKEVTRESDFYGSMDGASKFVRGDAVAGLLILAINLIGGISIGMFQHDLSMSQSFEIYALLTIGDGLVAQIPSLLLAVAAAIIVTRVSDAEDLPQQVSGQLLANPTVLMMAATILGIIGIVPGMPTFAFLSFAAVVGFAAWRLKVAQDVVPPIQEDDIIAQMTPKEPPLSWQELPHTDTLCLTLGYKLVHLVDNEKGAELVNRVRGVRRTLSEQVGFLAPEVRIKDDLRLKPNQYQILLRGSVVAQGTIEAEHLLAISGGDTYGDLDGIVCSDPAYGMPATWIKLEHKSKALNFGYSVVDSATVIGTHVSKVMQDNLAELLTHADVVKLNDRLGELDEKLQESLVSQLSYSQQLRIYRRLLEDYVPLVDIRAIATTLLESAELSKDPVLLAADVRLELRRNILNQVNGNDTEVHAFTLSAELEQQLVNAFNQSQQAGAQSPIDGFPIEPNLLGQLQTRMPAVKEQLQTQGYAPILLVMPQLRPLLSRYSRTFAKGLNVLSFNEIPDHTQVNVIGQLG